MIPICTSNQYPCLILIQIESQLLYHVVDILRGYAALRFLIPLGEYFLEVLAAGIASPNCPPNLLHLVDINLTLQCLMTKLLHPYELGFHRSLTMVIVLLFSQVFSIYLSLFIFWIKLTFIFHYPIIK